MKFLEPMIVAFSMYSKIPMPRIEWNKENMKYTMCFFPLIGVVTGVLIYLAGMFLDGNIFPKVNSGRLMFAAVMTLIPVFVSGGIHLDGFMDTMDALGSWGDKENATIIGSKNFIFRPSHPVLHTALREYHQKFPFYGTPEVPSQEAASLPLLLFLPPDTCHM